MIKNMNSKMTTNSQLLRTEPKNKSKLKKIYFKKERKKWKGGNYVTVYICQQFYRNADCQRMQKDLSVNTEKIKSIL